MRFSVHLILFILNLLAFVNSISSSSSDSSSSDSDSSSSSASSLSSRSNSASSSEKQDGFEVIQAHHTSTVPLNEPSLDNLSAAERKRIKNREYMREKRKRLPDLERETQRRYREANRNNPEWKAKKSLSDQKYRTNNKEQKRLRDQAYREKNHEIILQKQREARALQKQLSASSTKNRKGQETIGQPSQKKIRLDSNPKAHSTDQVQQSEKKVRSTLATPNIQQSQRRNVLRIKLSQKTIQKYLSNNQHSSPK